MAQIYKAGANEIALNGRRYIADENGVIDVPDDIALSAYQKGFSPAKGRLEQLAKEKERQAEQDKLKGQPAAVIPASSPAAPQPAKAKTSIGEDNK